jgi:hypothetical protein
MVTPAKTINARSLVDLLASHFFSREILAAHADAFSKALPANRQVVIAAMPKTGSTFLVKALAQLTGRAHNYSGYCGDNGEEQLYFPALVRDTLLRQAVTKMHLLATPTHLQLMRAFNITPIVQVRDLFDAVVSQRDHLVRDLGDQPQQQELASHLASLDEQGQYDYVIDTWLPWVVTFYKSWWEADRDGAIGMMWVDYDRLNADAAGVIDDVLAFLGIPSDAGGVRAVLASLDGKATRMNKAVVGRGRHLLTDEQRDRVVRLTRHFPWVDFTRVGVPRPR